MDILKLNNTPCKHECFFSIYNIPLNNDSWMKTLSCNLSMSWLIGFNCVCLNCNVLPLYLQLHLYIYLTILFVSCWYMISMHALHTISSNIISWLDWQLLYMVHMERVCQYMSAKWYKNKHIACRQKVNFVSIPKPKCVHTGVLF